MKLVFSTALFIRRSKFLFLCFERSLQGKNDFRFLVLFWFYCCKTKCSSPVFILNTAIIAAYCLTRCKNSASFRCWKIRRQCDLWFISITLRFLLFIITFRARSHFFFLPHSISISPSPNSISTVQHGIHPPRSHYELLNSPLVMRSLNIGPVHQWEWGHFKRKKKNLIANKYRTSARSRLSANYYS